MCRLYFKDQRRTRKGLASWLRETGGAMTLTTLTTGGAFAALSLTTFTGIRELGLIGGVGLVTCLLASVHLIPLGWSLLGEQRGPPWTAVR